MDRSRLTLKEWSLGAVIRLMPDAQKTRFLSCVDGISPRVAPAPGRSVEDRRRLNISEARTVPVRTEAVSRSTSSHCAAISFSSGRSAMNGASASHSDADPKA